MKFKIQLITQYETGEDIQELACLERETEGLEEIGITLAEAKTLLAKSKFLRNLGMFFLGKGLKVVEYELCIANSKQ